MTNQLGYTDPHILPAPLAALRGITKIFQIRFGKSSRAQAIEFIVDDLFDNKEIGATSKIAIHDIKTPTPTSPSLPFTSSSLPTQTKRLHESHAKKEIFPAASEALKPIQGNSKSQNILIYLIHRMNRVTNSMTYRDLFAHFFGDLFAHFFWPEHY